MINSISDIPEATLKEFMEWFTEQYEGWFLSSDMDRVIPALEGLRAGMGKDHPAYNICNDALVKLRNYKHLLSLIEITKYQYGNSHD